MPYHIHPDELVAIAERSNLQPADREKLLRAAARMRELEHNWKEAEHDRREVEVELAAERRNK